MESDGKLSQREEAELYRHYGLEYAEVRSGSGGDVSGRTTDDAMTRSEEELQVGTSERETGRARLRKYVVEDEVTYAAAHHVRAAPRSGGTAPRRGRRRT